VAAQYQSIEIEGQTFSVVRVVEQELQDGGTAMDVLLRLSPQDRDMLRTLLHEAHRNAAPGRAPTWQIRREGRDPTPITVMSGRFHWWSRHKDDDGTIYYKQIVQMLPMTAPVSGPGDLGLTLLLDHEVLTTMVEWLAERFELLADELLKVGSITEQVHASLTGEWADHVLEDDARVNAIMWATRRVKDAEECLSE